MAQVVVTVKIMPDSPEVNLEELQAKALEVIKTETDDSETKVSIEPVAFGLKSLNIIFVVQEDKGSPDPIAEKINEIEGVNSAEIVDVRRALG